MPRSKPKRQPKIKIKIKPARSSTADKIDDAQTRVLVKLRGEELARLHARVDAIDGSLARRATTQEQATTEMRGALRARDAGARLLSDRVDSLEARIAGMESAIFAVVPKAMQAIDTLREMQASPAHPPYVAPAPALVCCIPEPNGVGTEVQAAELAAADMSADESRVDVTMTPDNA